MCTFSNNINFNPHIHHIKKKDRKYIQKPIKTYDHHQYTRNRNSLPHSNIKKTVKSIYLEEIIVDKTKILSIIDKISLILYSEGIEFKSISILPKKDINCVIENESSK